MSAAQGAATLGVKTLVDVTQADIAAHYAQNPQGGAPLPTAATGEALNEVMAQGQAEAAGKALGDVMSPGRVSARNEDGTGATAGNDIAPPATPRNYPKDPVAMPDLEGGAIGVTASATGSIGGGAQIQVAFVCGGVAMECDFVVTGQVRTQLGANLGWSLGALASTDVTSMDQLGGGLGRVRS